MCSSDLADRAPAGQHRTRRAMRDPRRRTRPRLDRARTRRRRLRQGGAARRHPYPHRRALRPAPTRTPRHCAHARRRAIIPRHDLRASRVRPSAPPRVGPHPTVRPGWVDQPRQPPTPLPRPPPGEDAHRSTVRAGPFTLISNRGVHPIRVATRPRPDPGASAGERAHRDPAPAEKSGWATDRSRGSGGDPGNRPRPAEDQAALQTVSTMSRVTTYGSMLAFGRRSSM